MTTTNTNLTLEGVLELEENEDAQSIDEVNAVGAGGIVGGPMTTLGDDKSDYFPNGGEDSVGPVKTASPALHELMFSEGALDDYGLQTYKEPPRVGNDFKGLGLTKQALTRRRSMRAGIENIKKVYNEATENEKEYWGKWYKRAQYDVKLLAKRHGVNWKQTAAVCSILSASNSWPATLVAVDRILSDEEHENGIPALPQNVNKSRKLLDTGDIKTHLQGPKVTVFYRSLIKPGSVMDDFVIDGHAMNIWRGTKTPIKGLQITPQMRQKMVDDYLMAAEELGVHPEALQSVVWYVWQIAIKTKSENVPQGPFALGGSGFSVANDNDGLPAGKRDKKPAKSPQLSLPFSSKNESVVNLNDLNLIDS